GEDRVARLRLHDARLMIERRVRERRLLAERVAAQVQRHAGVAAVAVPVAPVAVEVADRGRDLLDLRLDLLQTDDVGLRRRDPLLELLATRADAVHVPGADFHRGRILAWWGHWNSECRMQNAETGTRWRMAPGFFIS